MSLALHGIGISRGIAIGKAFLLRRASLQVAEQTIHRSQVEREIERMRTATARARSHLESVREQIPPATSREIATFIDAHLLMLTDTALADGPIHLIRTRLCNAEWALKLQGDTLVRVFEEMADPYLRSRRDDVQHVVNLVQQLLAEEEERQSLARAAHPLRGYVLLAEDLTPADTLLYQQQGIAAFVTEFGGAMSHMAILARSLGIPAIVGVHNACELLEDGETLVVDGGQGVVVATPDRDILSYYRGLQADRRRRLAKLEQLRDRPSVTRDGQRVALMANIELPEDIQSVRSAGAAGVGLYRTEFLYMNRASGPDEEEQLEVYLRVLRQLDGAPLTIRTLDLGVENRPMEPRDCGAVPTNPALGLRAIRLCLRDVSLFRPQLRAILRASAFGPVRLMAPMLSTLAEVRQLHEMTRQAKESLRAQGLSFDPLMPVGGMIEVPAAAIAADLFAHSLDFLSIGTNDLIQFTLAIDRLNDEVNYLFDPLHPSVLRLIHQTIEAGRHAGIPVAMCGEMAGDSRYARLLLGLGLREFSMHPTSLLEVKSVVTQSDTAELSALAAGILRATDSEEIRDLVAQMNEATS